MRILVIKLGALGDFVQAFAAFRQIRQAHAADEITLLTTPSYAALARASGLFDRIETDGRPSGLGATLALFRRLRDQRYGRVYDLQTSSRSRWFLLGFWPRRPEWSGISPGASHRQTRPDRDALHNLDRLADQLHVAGAGPAYALGAAPGPDLSWAARVPGAEPEALMARFGLASPFTLLAPGASTVKPEKCWPVEAYAELSQALVAQGMRVAVVGGPAEAALFAPIAARAPGATDLTGRTSLVELASLASRAALAVGNDSGPTHLMAYAGAPGVMLMSRVTDPGHCAPRARMQWLKTEDLRDLGVDRVLTACREALLGG
ncbi:MAG TPA: glycosyltransferase family 9 protein [Caulobacteraceae bacterium]|nr:glycosyltransferase family 9 protein [Caulobacteraceae bacterium]